MMTLETVIQIGGLLHFAIFLIAIWVPRVMDWKKLLSLLEPMMRHLLWVYAVFIMFVILGFGTLSLFFAAALASGTGLAKFLCGFIAIFWIGRVFVQLFLFDIRPLVHHWFFKLGFHVLTAIFTCLSGIYLLVIFLS